VIEGCSRGVAAASSGISLEAGNPAAVLRGSPVDFTGRQDR